MKVFGTDMELITFVFICVELAFLFAITLIDITRSRNFANTGLLLLLIFYNLASGLFPDTQYPINYQLQTIVAYFSGFITPAYFPYYVYTSFKIEALRWHIYSGVTLFLLFPFFLFALVFTLTDNLDYANYVLLIPLGYAFFFVAKMIRIMGVMRQKQVEESRTGQSLYIVIACLIPWATIPLITIFHLSQAVESLLTNIGFLLLMGVQIRHYVQQQQMTLRTVKDFNKSLQVEIEKRTDHIKELYKGQAQAFINIAHEIKTPLTLTKSYLHDLVDRYPRSEEAKLAKNNIDKIIRDVTNFFDIEKAEKGFLIYNTLETNDFSKILTDRVQLYHTFSQQRKIDFKAQIEPEIFINVSSDAIDRIVFNLIENAFKFTQEGERITVKLYKSDTAVFEVCDTGVGVDPGEAKTIFEPYVRLNHQNRQHPNTGMGLGLSIVHSILEQIGGKINVYPNGDKGSLFRVNLPLSKSVPETDATKPVLDTYVPDMRVINTESCNTSIDSDKKTILIIEDNAQLLKYLFERFSGSGYNVVTAINGRMGIEKISSFESLPDLVLTDLMMPEGEGQLLIDFIERTAHCRHIPIIVISAKTNVHLQHMSEAVVDFVPKPFDVTELMQKVTRILSLEERFLTSQENMPAGTHDDAGTPNEEKALLLPAVLTKREKEVAKFLIEGHTNKSISDTLFISVTTVNKHVANIYQKLDVSSRVMLLQKLRQSA